jgi:hypothetical protein
MPEVRGSYERICSDGFLLRLTRLEEDAIVALQYTCRQERCASLSVCDVSVSPDLA